MDGSEELDSSGDTNSIVDPLRRGAGTEDRISRRESRQAQHLAIGIFLLGFRGDAAAGGLPLRP